jgi:hypothetical protein
MNYLTVDELTRFAPQVEVDDDQAEFYIELGSGDVDVACRRAEHGLGLTMLYDQQIPLDKNLSGILAHTPFHSWGDDTPVLIEPGSAVPLPQLELSNFDVKKSSGIIRYTAPLIGFGFVPLMHTVSTNYAQLQSAYRSGNVNQIDGNRFPFQLTASYRAGFFSILDLVANGDDADSGESDPAVSIGDNTCTVSDASGLKRGQQFYFSSDPVEEPSVSTRTITGIADDVVTFSPAVRSTVTVDAQFRAIDLAVRRATGIMIANLVTYPVGTSKYSKGLGRAAIIKHWQARSNEPFDNKALSYLSRYSR